MKNLYLNNESIWKHAVKTVFVAICLFGISCNMEEEIDIESTPLSVESSVNGKYQLTNTLIVNSENGIPQRLQNLNTFGNELSLNADGSYTTDKLQGKWSENENRLLLFTDNGFDLSLKITDIGEEELELEQEFDSQGSYANGVIYYSLSKQPKEIDTDSNWLNVFDLLKI